MMFGGSWKLVALDVDANAGESSNGGRWEVAMERDANWIRWATVVGLLSTATLSLTRTADATIYGTSQSTCDTHVDLQVGAPRPYNAVGYLNGCTAFLIASNVIATAAHCLARPSDGAWVMDGTVQGYVSNKFYLNFHPERTGIPYKVPRADVTRWIVGTRTNIDGGYPGEMGGSDDWGLAWLSNWQDLWGEDITPIPLDTAPAYNTAVYLPGYPRHWFPLAEMIDWTCSNSEGYYRQVGLGSAPSGETYDCGHRWARGLIRYDSTYNFCLIKGTDGMITHNCSNSGGNSGSPLINYSQTAALGIAHGAGHSFPAPPETPVCTTNPLDGMNTVVKAERFVGVPQNAVNVAVARRTDGAAATGVFAADNAAGTIRYRARTGPSPDYWYSPFSFWNDFGGPGGAAPTKLAACDQTPNNPTPRVFAITGAAPSATTLYSWVSPVSWANFTKPAGALYDVDTAGEVSSNRCQVYVVADGDVYTRWMQTETQWVSYWARVTNNGIYRKVTSQRVGNVIYLFMLSTSGSLYWTRYNGSWSVPQWVLPPNGVTSWWDVDLGYDSLGNARLYGIAGGTNLYSTPVSAGGFSAQWSTMVTSLYDTNPGPDGPGPLLATITADKWRESGQTSPVIFGNDFHGNVYVLSYYNDSRWKSFYGKYIPYQ